MSNRLPVGYRFYWDEYCRLCNVCKRIGSVLDWSNKVTFIPLLSDAAEVDLGHLSMEVRMASSHLVTPDHQVRSAGEGVLALGALLPILAPFVFVFRLLPGHRALAEKLYVLVSSNRGPTCGDSCSVNFGDD